MYYALSVLAVHIAMHPKSKMTYYRYYYVIINNSQWAVYRLRERIVTILLITKAKLLSYVIVPIYTGQTPNDCQNNWKHNPEAVIVRSLKVGTPSASRLLSWWDKYGYIGIVPTQSGRMATLAPTRDYSFAIFAAELYRTFTRGAPRMKIITSKRKNNGLFSLLTSWTWQSFTICLSDTTIGARIVLRPWSTKIKCSDSPKWKSRRKRKLLDDDSLFVRREARQNCIFITFPYLITSEPAVEYLADETFLEPLYAVLCPVAGWQTINRNSSGMLGSAVWISRYVAAAIFRASFCSSSQDYSFTRAQRLIVQLSYSRIFNSFFIKDSLAKYWSFTDSPQELC